MHICDPYVNIAHDSKSPMNIEWPYVGIANFSFHHGDFTRQYVNIAYEFKTLTMQMWNYYRRIEDGFEPKTQKFSKN
jgi:hypothetical protein